MEVGISGLLKLCSNERLRIAGREILGALDGALHALAFGRANYLRSESAHDDNFLFGIPLRNEQHDFVTTIHADQRQSDARVSGGRFDDGAATS